MSEVTPSDAPAGLEERGAALWRQASALYRLGPGHLTLLHEACRLADRLERMDALLRGDTSTWATLTIGDGFDALEAKLEISSVLVEARLTATALKGVLTELRQAGAVGAVDESSSSSAGTAEEVGGDVIDLLKRRSRDRRTSTP